LAILDTSDQSGRNIGSGIDPCKECITRDSDVSTKTAYREVFSLRELVGCRLTDVQKLSDFGDSHKCAYIIIGIVFHRVFLLIYSGKRKHHAGSKTLHGVDGRLADYS
jgi:hypothetical protein